MTEPQFTDGSTRRLHEVLQAIVRKFGPCVCDPRIKFVCSGCAERKRYFKRLRRDERMGQEP